MAEFEIKFVKKYFVFLDNFFGRGLFVIYLSTLTSQALNNTLHISEIFVYIIAIGIFSVGCLYIVLSFF